METDAPLLGEPLPVELMNTVWADREGVHDALADPGAAAAWLRAIAPRTPVELPRAMRGEQALDQLHVLRDDLRRLAAEVTADPRDRARVQSASLTAAVKAVNLASASMPTWPELVWNQHHVPARVLKTAGNPAQTLISLLAQQGIELFTGEQRELLRACLAPGCVLYFVRNHPRREWCSPSCGNRARVTRHYHRHHGAPA